MMAESSKKKVPSPRTSAGRRKYKNPPIVEATCEFLFSPTDDWNLAYTGLFLEKVKHRYDGKPREQRLVQVDTRGAAQMSAAEGQLPPMREVTRVQIPSANGHEMVSLSPGTLAAHSMTPYSGWETFKPQISEALAIFLKIANPDGIRRIGMRYINFIERPVSDLVPGKYFTAPPPEMDALRLDVFSMRQEYIYADDNTKLVTNLARVASPEGKKGFLLDLDVIREYASDLLPTDRAMKVVEDFRKRERDAFEALITDEARKLFDE